MRYLFVTLIAFASMGQAGAQSGPSEAQQRLACMGDALRLCPQHIPRREEIIQCLAAQRNALSDGCRPVFDASYKALMAHRRHGS